MFFVPLQNALSFLTRLVPPSAQTLPFEHCFFFFALAGLLLGFFWLLCMVVLQFFLPGTLTSLESALLLGFFWLTLNVYSTRGMHLDGVADLGDALGSGASKERFWQILHDSRLGAFGAMTLFLVLLGEFVAASLHFAHNGLLFLLLAPAWGRCAPFWVARDISAHPSSKLGVLVTNALANNAHLLRLYKLFFFALSFCPFHAATS